MKTTKSIKEMRGLAQKGRETEIYHMNWFDKYISRKISIYITKLFLKAGISANQATVIDFLLVIIGGVFFIFTSPIYWLTGILFFFLYLLVDCVDGEIARYSKSSSQFGSFLGGVVDWITWPYILACMAFGIYGVIGSTVVFAFGFLAAVLRVIYLTCALMPYPMLHSEGKLERELNDVKGVTLGESRILSYGRVLFGVQGFLPVILLVTILDYFLPTFTIGSFMLNARFIYLIMFGLAASAGVIARIHDVFRHGVRIQRL